MSKSCWKKGYTETDFDPMSEVVSFVILKMLQWDIVTVNSICPTSLFPGSRSCKPARLPRLQHSFDTICRDSLHHNQNQGGFISKCWADLQH